MVLRSSSCTHANYFISFYDVSHYPHDLNIASLPISFELIFRDWLRNHTTYRQFIFMIFFDYHTNLKRDQEHYQLLGDIFLDWNVVSFNKRRWLLKRLSIFGVFKSPKPITGLITARWNSAARKRSFAAQNKPSNFSLTEFLTDCWVKPPK